MRRIRQRPGLVCFLNSLRKEYLLYHSLTSAAKADTENTAAIAAVNRCATQNQVQHRVFLQAVKTCPLNMRLLATCLLTALAALILARPSYVLAQDKPQDKQTSATGNPQVAKAVGTIKSIQ